MELDTQNNAPQVAPRIAPRLAAARIEPSGAPRIDLAGARVGASGSPAAESGSVPSENRFDFRAQLGGPLRVGGIDYLNSRPLVDPIEEVAGKEVVVLHRPPSTLARMLRARELDVALVPVVEYFMAPCAADRYWIVPGVGISSYGPVESIRLYHRMPLHGVERVALDASSMTSALLTRLLFTARPDRRWGDPEAECAAPEFVSADIEDGIAWVRGNDGPGPAPEAVLLIGDAALQVEPAADWSVVDLGLEWTRWTGLPFVYAVWVFQGEPIAGVAECLQRVGHSGLAGIDRIARFGPLPAGMRPEDCRRYLGHSIRYRLGSLELEGLELFRRLLDEHGLLGGAAASPLRFLNGR